MIEKTIWSFVRMSVCTIIIFQAMSCYHCKNCKDTGIVNVECNKCHSTGYTLCICNNRGYSDCSFCNKGHVECSFCNEGYIIVDDDVKICTSCKGNYLKLCSSCRGYYRKVCPVCNGVKKVCSNCKGQKIQCPYCN